MSDVSDTLEKKLGPLPAWMWGVAAAGFYVLYRYWSASQASAQVPTDVGETPLDSSLNNIPASPGSTTTTGNESITNAAWIQEVIQGLLSFGHDALHVQKALDDYFAGNPLTYEEGQIISEALAKYGPPPEGAPALSTIGTAASSLANQLAAAKANLLHFQQQVKLTQQHVTTAQAAYSKHKTKANLDQLNYWKTRLAGYQKQATTYQTQVDTLTQNLKGT